MAKVAAKTSSKTPPDGRELHGGYAAVLPKRINQNTARGLETRRKLILTTIDCLYKQGYYRTSTVAVAEAAKVSRGSMLNQFPTKADLMIAVVEHIAQMRAAAHEAGLDDAVSYEDKFARLTPILWSELKSPSGIARIELMLASRSDPELADKFARLNELLEEAHRRVVWKLFRSLGLQRRDISDAAVQLYTAALRGLSIDLMLPGRRQTIEDAALLMQSFMQSLLDHADYHAMAVRPPRDGFPHLVD